nr:reverse transcriptase domain-containing protein [Tanacetum cinerariifolium]
TASRINIIYFCEEHYEYILPVMDKIRYDKRREVHTRLDFEEDSRKSQRMREDSQNSSDKTLSARYRNPSERPRIRDRLRNNDGNVFGRLGHRRESAFKRLSDTYSPSTTKSGPDKEYSRDDSYNRDRPHKRNSSPSRDRPRSRDHSHGIEESYGNTYSSYRTEDKHRYHSHGTGRSSSMKRGRNSESSLSRVSESGTSERGYWKSKSKRDKPTDEEDLAVPWSCEEVDPFTPRIRNFKSSRKTRMPNNVKTYDGTGDPEDHVKIFQAAAQVERWEMPTWYHMFNSTLIGTVRVWFDELPPESIDGYKDLKAAFLAYFMQQKKNQPKDERGSNKFTPLTRTPKEIFAAESGKFKPPPPMVTPVEKRRSNKFCDFHNDKGHSTDECVQLRKKIKELVRADKLWHFIKEIRRDRDQQNTRKKD